MLGMHRLLQHQTGDEKTMGLSKICTSQSDHRRWKKISNNQIDGLANSLVTAKGKGIGIRQIDTRGG